MASWPSTLPQELIAETLSIEMPDNLLRSDMDIGPAKVRRRTTSNVTKVSGDIIVTRDQYNTLSSFFSNNASYGATEFDWINPITGSSCSMRFSAPPRVKPEKGSLLRVSLSLEIMP
mgnify:CR=1 FL=1